MPRRSASVAAAISLCASLAPVHAQTAPTTTRPGLVVSVDWLRAHLHDAGLVILELPAPASPPPGDPSPAVSGHVPGARTVRYDDYTTAAGALTAEIPPVDQLRARVEAFGISRRSVVVVVYPSRLIYPAIRLVMTLRMLGLDRVSLLNGGLSAWVNAGGALESDEPAAAPRGDLKGLAAIPYVVDAAFVRAHEGARGFALVDARPRVFFDGLRGETPGGGGPTGHIHGAIALPASELVTPDSSLKAPADLAAAFTAAGIGPRDTVVAYCSVGLVANTTLLAAASLGHPVRLYDGSAQEWLALGLPFDK